MLNRKYVLAIKRNNNDYLPLEWHLTPFYHGQDLSTLEGIDSFTKQITEVGLLESLVDLNILNIQEMFMNFVIIFQEKGRIRELKDGTLFADTPILLEDELIYFILNNMHDKKLINRIYNVCAALGPVNIDLEKFKLSLNNLDLLMQHNPQAPEIALRVFSNIPYDLRRSILIRVSTKVLPLHIKDKENEQRFRKVNDGERRVA